MQPSLANLELRHKAIHAMRRWFHGRGFIEVETPVRIPHPAPEAYIDCPPAGGAWLRASPELQMKRLLAVGADRIFQIGACFREGERGSRHNPEFTMPGCVLLGHPRRLPRAHRRLGGQLDRLDDHTS